VNVFDLKILEFLHQNKDSYISGQQLAKELGVSRTAIWKHINNLRDVGYQIESSSKKGYQLISCPENLIAEEVRRGLNCQEIGREILVFPVLDSTNIKAKELGRKGYPDGTVIIAEEQNNGKGRMGRDWYSPGRTGLWFSILLRPEIPPIRAPFLTIIASIAVVKAIKRIDTGIKPEIKWPNDILIQGKKVCGILSELSADLGKIKYTVVGIGINVNQKNFPTGLLDKASSLKKHTGYRIDRTVLMRSVLEFFERGYQQLELQEYNRILDEWKSYLKIVGREVFVYNGSEKVEGKVIGISSQGELILQDKNGTNHYFWAGDVSLRKR